MYFGIAPKPELNEILFLVLTALIAASASFAVFLACFYWFRRDQRKLQRNMLNAIARVTMSDTDELFVTGQEAVSRGELVAQFKVNQGKQVVSLLEADGKRFIHVDGELSGPERSKMVRYLKSEGFMS